MGDVDGNFSKNVDDKMHSTHIFAIRVTMEMEPSWSMDFRKVYMTDK